MSLYNKNGRTWIPHRDNALDLQPMLPVGTYAVKFNELPPQFYLEEIDGFTLPTKIYGDVPTQAARITKTFAARPRSTGVLLTGEKGSGKTLLAKTICARLAEQGLPTLVITSNFRGDRFNTFLQSIEQPTIVLFDEFEKVYDSEEQQELLTLLDGVYSSKKLFILTCNNPWRIDENMRNRPGRLFYYIKFSGLERKFIEQYCNDVLINKTHIPRILQLCGLFGQFNFDMLQSLVEEMNRFNEDPDTSLKLINAKPDNEGDDMFDGRLLYNDVTYAGSVLMNNGEFDVSPMREESIMVGATVLPCRQEFSGAVISDRASLMAALKAVFNKPSSNSGGGPGLAGDDDDDDDDDNSPQCHTRHFSFRQNHFVRFDVANETYVFKNAEATLLLKRRRPVTHPHYAY